MSFGKTLSLGILALGLLGSAAQADPISSVSGSGQWTFWSQSTNSTISAPSAPTPPPEPLGTPAPAISSTSSSFSETTSPPPSTSQSSGDRPDAFLNFGNGNYAGSSLMTTGTIQPWYQSPTVVQAFGGVPSAQQQTDFANTVLNRVEQTFQQSGVNVNLSLDPNSQAAHTLSVVSGASYGMNPGAIGISEVGGNGFSFIDKLNYGGSSGNAVDQLAWADARNIAHELMHAFGVSVHHDQTGKYLDAGSATWDVLTSPSTTFSPEAASDIKASLASNRSGSSLSLGAELLGSSQHSSQLGSACPHCVRGTMLSHGFALELGDAATVPEPTTMMLWTAGAVVSLVTLNHRRRGDRSSRQSS